MHNQTWKTLISAPYIGAILLRFQQTGWDTEKIIIAITGVLAILSTLIGVLNTARNDAFRNLQLVNQDLRITLQQKEDELKAFRKYQRVLIKALQEHDIDVPDQE